MSSLWSDRALAQAGWADAVERGLVDAGASAKWRDRVRRVRRPQVHSFAL